jgi:hypothetical protein
VSLALQAKPADARGTPDTSGHDRLIVAAQNRRNGATRLLAKVERLARSITDPARSGATTLAHVAKVLKATSPNRSAWLLADAEDLAGV